MRTPRLLSDRRSLMAALLGAVLIFGLVRARYDDAPWNLFFAIALTLWGINLLVFTLGRESLTDPSSDS